MAQAIHATLIELPDELRGSRVVLRPYRADDAGDVLEAVDESREHLRPWVNWVDAMATHEDCRDYCIRCAAKWSLRTDLSVGIFDAGSGRYLGGTGLHEPDWELRSFEIGYWIRRSAEGSGYVSEAVRLLIELAFGCLQARRVQLTCDADNHASRRVAEHAGFVLEGTPRNAAVGREGEAMDWLMFSLVPADLDRPGVSAPNAPAKTASRA